MIIEHFEHNKYRFICNDHEDDEDFDDLIFEMEIIEQKTTPLPDHIYQTTEFYYCYSNDDYLMFGNFCAANLPDVTAIGRPPFIAVHLPAKTTFERPFKVFFIVSALYPFCSLKLIYAP